MLSFPVFFLCLLLLLNSRVWLPLPPLKFQISTLQGRQAEQEYAFSGAVDKGRCQRPSDRTEHTLRNTKLKPLCCNQQSEQCDGSVLLTAASVLPSQISPKRNQIKKNYSMFSGWKERGEEWGKWQALKKLKTGEEIKMAGPKRKQTGE